MTSSPDVFYFSAEDWTRKDRVEGWREMVGRAIMRLQIDPVGDGGFDAQLRLRALPGLGLAEGRGVGMDFRRTTSFLDDDDLVLNIVREGTVAIRQRGREYLVSGGQAVLATGAETGQTTILGPARMTTLRIPRLAVVPMVREVESGIMRLIPAEDHALRLLVGYTDLIQQASGPFDPRLAQAAAGHVHDLVALAIGCTPDAADQSRERGVRAARLAALKADLRQNAHRPDFGVGVLARRHGVTVRYVQMLFSTSGGTFSEVLLEERLQQAHRILENAASLHQSIVAIALEVGFNDASYFHRTFRRRFGMAPGELRAETHQNRR